MIPRAAKTIFESFDAVKADYAVKISYLEICKPFSPLLYLMTCDDGNL